MNVLAIAAGLLVALAACVPQQPQRTRPASLDLVPPSYYSRRPPAPRAMRREEPAAVSVKPRGRNRTDPAGQEEAQTGNADLDELEARAEEIGKKLRTIRRKLIETQ